MFSKFLRYSVVGGGVATISAYNLNTNCRKKIDSLSIMRYGRTFSNVALIAIDYKYNLYNTINDRDSVISQIHSRSANRLKNLFCLNGGVFIKVGQFIGSLDYLLPDEYVQTMKTLHDKAPQSNVEDLFETIETDFNCKINDIFKDIEKEPIGTASLAQCHKATLHDGTVVAVKIQHPSIIHSSKLDMKAISFLVHTIAALFPQFKFLWLSEETEKNLPIELDFINEGKNIEKITKIFKNVSFMKVVICLPCHKLKFFLNSIS
jgi:aarF domain-containing kinase